MKWAQILNLFSTAALVATAPLVWSLTAFAANTDPSYIRLDESAVQPDGIRIDGSMVHVEVRDQHQIGSCYAHAAAQMYDAWRFRHGEMSADDDENMSSGFEIGQRFKIEKNEKVEKGSALRGRLDTNINGGFVGRILPFLGREGTCSQKELDGLFRKDVRDATGLNVDLYASEIMSKFGLYKQIYEDGVAEIRKRYHPEDFVGDSDEAANLLQPMAADHIRVASSRLFTYPPEAKELEALRKQVLADGVNDLKSYNDSVLSNPDVGIHYEDLWSAIHYGTSAEQVNTEKMFETISVIDCPVAHRLMTRARFKVKKQSTYSDGFNLFGKNRPLYLSDLFRTTVNAELDRGLAKAYPIGISFCSTILTEGRAFRARVNDKKGDDAIEPVHGTVAASAPGACARHSSLIIGRREDPTRSGRIQYLIRNSWGVDACGNYSPDWECDPNRGAVWVDADALGSAVYEVQTLESAAD